MYSIYKHVLESHLFSAKGCYFTFLSIHFPIIVWYGTPFFSAFAFTRWSVFDEILMLITVSLTSSGLEFVTLVTRIFFVTEFFAANFFAGFFAGFFVVIFLVGFLVFIGIV